IGWRGTIDDASLSAGNFVVMPDAAHEAVARYGQSVVLGQHLFLPSVVSIPSGVPPCHQGTREIEPNNRREEAERNSHFCFGRTYRGLPTDMWDMFAYNLPAAGRISAVVTDLQWDQGRVALLISTPEGGEVARDETPGDGLS